MKFCVTGGAGFIGSHFVDAVLKQGHKVIVIDSLKYGSLSNLKMVENDSLQFHEIDISHLNIDSARKLLDGVDCLVHLAAEKHNNSANEHRLVADANCTGTAELFHAAVNQGVKHIIFSSSLYSYGNYHSMSMHENDVCAPDSYYGASKLAGEMFLRAACKGTQTNFSIFRLFFTYGTHQFPGLGYPSVIVKNFTRMLRGEAPVIVNDGQQALDYIYVSDVVEAMLLSISREQNTCLNVGSGKAVSIIELTKLMAEIASCELPPVFCGSDWTASTYRAADNGQLRQELNWEPKVSLVDGLQRTYNWLSSSRELWDI